MGMLEAKEQTLLASLERLSSVIVAYSGGADSAYLAWAAHRALGDKAVAITADSASLPDSHKADAEEFARVQGFRHEYIATYEFDNPDYVKNDRDRCFHCKDELFTQLDKTARERGIAHVVYGVRNDRASDGFFKRATAQIFYRLISALGAESVYNHADFRLMSRRAVEALMSFREVNLFLRGMVPLIGFKSAIVYYTRSERFAGESKYPLRKMVALALDAVTSFSIAPLRFITGLGFLVFLLSAAMGMWTLWVRLFTDRAVPGWTSTLLPIYLLGGIQILCTGVLGEYLGRVYQETKARPRYIIEKQV